jgi:hypothetical protein
MTATIIQTKKNNFKLISILSGTFVLLVLVGGGIYFGQNYIKTNSREIQAEQAKANNALDFGGFPAQSDSNTITKTMEELIKESEDKLSPEQKAKNQAIIDAMNSTPSPTSSSEASK